jgi:hypothetical protein
MSHCKGTDERVTPMNQKKTQVTGAFLVGDQVPKPLREFFKDQDTIKNFWCRSESESKLDALFALKDERE